MILGIDTSAAQCAVALLGAGPMNEANPVVERRAMERGHAEHLFPMIDSVLGRAGIGYEGVGALRRRRWRTTIFMTWTGRSSRRSSEIAHHGQAIVCTPLAKSAAARRCLKTAVSPTNFRRS